MPKDFGSFFSLVNSRKVSFFGRIKSNFDLSKVTCRLYHSGTVRHSTVNKVDFKFNSIFHLILVLNNYMHIA